MQIEDKAIRLGKKAIDLKKRVAQIEEHVQPSTPQKVLEERRKEWVKLQIKKKKQKWYVLMLSTKSLKLGKH